MWWNCLGAVAYDTKTLRRLAMFVLNRATSDLRSELHEYLVMVALSDDKEKRGMTKAKIISAIENDLRVSNFPDASIKSAIERLKEKRYIEAIHGKGEDVYLLSQDKIKAIEVMGDLYSKTVVRVKETLAKRISNIKGSPIDLGAENIVFASFQKMLGIVLSGLGEECCYAIVSSRGKELGSFGNDQEIEIEGNGWHGSNDPPGYADFDFIKVVQLRLLENFPVRNIDGVGKVIAERLEKQGIKTVNDLASSDVPALYKNADIPFFRFYEIKRKATLALDVKIERALFGNILQMQLGEIIAMPDEELSRKTNQPIEIISDLKTGISTLLVSLDNAIVRPMTLEKLAT